MRVYQQFKSVGFAYVFRQQTECSQCNCEDFLEIDDTTSGNSSVNSTTVELVTTETADVTTVNSTQVYTVEGKRATQRPWTIRKKDADGDDISDEDSGRWTTQRACGLQLHPNGNASQAVLWCRYYEDEWPMTSQSVDLDFDPSVEERHYSIHFNVMPFDAKEVSLLKTKFVVIKLFTFQAQK